MKTESRTAKAVHELSFRLRGGLYQAGEAEYEDACTLYNSMVEKRPRYVARCVAADDVVAALAFARARGLEVAVRSGGHSVTGASLCEDGVVLDVRGMADVEVDPQRRVARVAGGANWSHVDRATQPHGLATTGGRVSTTGVAGLTTGGGSGWLERKHGLACDNLLAAELVTADGRLVRASEDDNPELLWALRGGGANFGAITSLEFRLHPIESEVFGGIALYPLERAGEILAAWRDAMLAAPDELSLAYAVLTAPAEEGVPEHLHGTLVAAVVGMYAGPADEGEKVTRGLRELGAAADFFGPTTYADLQCAFDDPPGFRNYWTAEYLAEMPDAAVAALTSRSREIDPGYSQLFIPAWGGAVDRAAAGSSPLAGREAKFVVHPLLLWEDPARDERNMALGRAFGSDLKEFATGAAYLNFMGDEGEGRVRAAFGADHERILRVKEEWDPENVFRGNQSLRPRRAAAAV